MMSAFGKDVIDSILDDIIVSMFNSLEGKMSLWFMKECPYS